MDKRIYGYFEDDDSFHLTTIKKWEEGLSVSGIQKYLENHVLKSLRDDFLPALKTYKKKNVGYFALMRIIFPYITFLGSLYRGIDETKSALQFMVDYMGRVDDEYRHKAGVYYVAHRHGLLHTNSSKIFIYGKKKLGWYVSFANVGRRNRGDFLGSNLGMYPRLFFDDLCSAMDLYIKDFDNNRKEKELIKNFKKGFIKMAKLHSIKDVGRDKTVRQLVRRGLRKYGVVPR